MKFVFAFLLIALAYTQVSQSYIIQDDYESRNWIEDQAKELLQKLYQTIKDSLSGGLGTIIDAWNNVQNAEGNILENIKARFQSVLKAAQGVIGEWKDKAQKAGVDVKECYVTQEQELQNLPQKALAKAQVCLDNEIAAGQKIFDGFKKFLDDTLAKFTNLKLDEKFKKCASSGFWEIFPCFTNLISEITSLITNIPSDISKQVDEVKKYFTAMLPRLQACGTEQVNSLQKDVQTIVESIVTCIKNKIGAKTERVFLLA